MITMASNSSALGSDAEITPLLTQPLPRDRFPDGTSNPVEPGSFTFELDAGPRGAVALLE